MKVLVVRGRLVRLNFRASAMCGGREREKLLVARGGVVLYEKCTRGLWLRKNGIPVVIRVVFEIEERPDMITYTYYIRVLHFFSYLSTHSFH